MRTVLAAVLLLVGAGLIAVSALGLLRLPDVYNRMNAVAKAASLGVVCVLLGVLVLVFDARSAVVVAVAIGLQLVSAPVGGYALAVASYRAGSPLAPVTRYDDLADAGFGAGPGSDPPGGRAGGRAGGTAGGGSTGG
ncbi:multicomponent Na+:H+ antiporter subunit G [Micromonospora coxensis]|uniref:Multicomponent Na+:H+ antiporter subunit G n=2 Tax=Micromonospora coxensis TaxID=356852 RepID=A0A1C5HM01_9ACTN|nr:multicomponent Na+:H+ antiporter subunit G [Micromonospora coxensis]